MTALQLMIFNLIMWLVYWSDPQPPQLNYEAAPAQEMNEALTRS